MKTTKHLFILSIVCCLLIACERPRTYYTREDFIDRALELATFLTDNYTVYDSILSFKTEVGDTVPFNVKDNDFHENVFYSAWEEGDLFDTIHEGFHLATRLKEIDNEQYITIEINHGPTINFLEGYKTDTYSRLLSTNGKLLYDIETDTYGEYEWKETNDTIFIRYANMTCTLKKNVGIVKFTCDEHSWVLIEN